jgi:hypothetical protein
MLLRPGPLRAWVPPLFAALRVQGSGHRGMRPLRKRRAQREPGPRPSRAQGRRAGLEELCQGRVQALQGRLGRRLPCCRRAGRGRVRSGGRARGGAALAGGHQQAPRRREHLAPPRVELGGGGCARRLRGGRGGGGGGRKGEQDGWIGGQQPPASPRPACQPAAGPCLQPAPPAARRRARRRGRGGWRCRGRAARWPQSVRVPQRARPRRRPRLRRKRPAAAARPTRRARAPTAPAWGMGGGQGAAALRVCGLLLPYPVRQLVQP